MVIKNKLKLHFYGKSIDPDFKIIHDVLKESNEYETTYQYFDIGEGVKPSFDIDYLITSHSSPRIFESKVIHTHHGLGCIPELPKPFNTTVMNYFRQINTYAYCKYGKMQKAWLEGVGFPSERILVIGMAASIDLLSPTDAEGRGRFLVKKGLNPARKTVMYGPTWNNLDKRAFFYLWWRDGKEANRVERFCGFITRDLNLNLIVRFHEKRRYSQDWIKKYQSIFDKYKVSAHYLSQDPHSIPYFKYSEFLVGDLSTLNTFFYVMDKPVIHIGANPFEKKRQARQGSMTMSDRAGYVVEDFQDLLDKIEDSVMNPSKFSIERKRTVDKYIDYLGEDSRKAILSEFRRFLYDDKRK